MPKDKSEIVTEVVGSNTANPSVNSKTVDYRRKSGPDGTEPVKNAKYPEEYSRKKADKASKKAEEDELRRQQEESEAAKRAAAEEAAKFSLQQGSLQKMESLPARVKDEVFNHVKSLNTPVNKKEIKLRDSFLKRVREEAAEPGKYLDYRKGKDKISAELLKGQYRPEYIELMQKMFNYEMLQLAKEAYEKYQAEKAKKEADDKAENVKKAKEKKAKKDKKKKEHKAYHANVAKYYGIDIAEEVLLAPTQLATGFLKFINDNMPADHKDEFLLALKLFEGFCSLLEIPFDIVKQKLSKVIKENSTPEQKKAWEEYEKAHKDERHKHEGKLSDANSKSNEELKKLAADLEISNPEYARGDSRSR